MGPALTMTGEASRTNALLSAELLVRPPAGANCALVENQEDGAITRHNFWTGEGSTCRSEFVSDETTRVLESDVEPSCACPIFVNHDCVMSVDGFRDGWLQITATAEGRDSLSGVITALREHGATIHLEKLCITQAGEATETIEIPVDAITDKQREAVRTAIEHGYYDSPRQSELADLAELLGVTRSAVSQRLNAVEKKLVTELDNSKD